MLKFNLSDPKDHKALQERLNWISQTDLATTPDWVWLAACRQLEQDCGLPEGFLNTDLPGFSQRGKVVTVAILQEYAPRTISA